MEELPQGAQNAVNGEYFEVTADHRVVLHIKKLCDYTIAYERLKCTITVQQGQGGTISPSTVTVLEDDDITFKISANSGYTIANVLVDGTSVGAVSSYTFKAVAGNGTIGATFKRRSGSFGGLVIAAGDWDNPYTDVNMTDWYYEDVKAVCRKGLMKGVSHTAFAPGDTTTRAMMVTMLYRLEGSPAVSGGSGFADVIPGSWYAAPVAWARQSGVVNGVSDTVFAPDQAVTRQELAVMLYRYAGSPQHTDMALSGFTDAAYVSGYAEAAMSWAVRNGIIKGSNHHLNPAATATRAETAAMLQRFIAR